MKVKIDITKTEILSIYGGTSVMYTACFSIEYDKLKCLGDFTFTRDPITGIVYIEDIYNVHNDDNNGENALVIDEDQIATILDEYLMK